MKLKIVILFGAALATVAHADYNPILLTPGSFTADVVVEKTAPPPLNNYVTATMDGGTNNSSNTWYEQGFNTNMPSTGLPPAGTVFTAVANANHQFRMPASYAANNALFINSQVPTGTLTLTTPTVLSGLSLLGASGDGAIGLTARVHYLDGSSEDVSISCPDWYNGVDVAWVANGRFSLDNLRFENVYGNNPRVNCVDFTVYGTTPVTSVDFTYVSGGGRSCLFGLSGLVPSGTDYTPLAVTGFTRDMVVEAAAPHVYGCLYSATTATMDGGTNNQSNTWYERGLNTGTPTSGLPPAGTTFTASGSATHSFTMPASYVGNNALFIAATVTDGSLTLNTPTLLTGLSFLSSSASGPVPMNYTVYFQDGNSETGSFTSPDWFTTTDASTGWNSNGRFNNDDPGFNEVGNQRPRLHFNDIALTYTASPVARIDFSYGGSGGRLSLFAVSGQVSTGGSFTPLAVSGFNRDMVVENVSPVTKYTQPARLNGYTTVSMDGGTNNTGNTWYERGYYALFPNSGLPPAGSSITSLNLPDHYYQMPASYAANNAIYVDAANPVANVTLVTPARYSALSFLSATAQGNVTNQCIMQYSDGTSETNTFTSLDWFNNNPYAYRALGRVDLNNQTVNEDPGRNGTNPRLYEAQFALNAAPGVTLTNILLTFLGAPDPNARMVVLAVSGTAGAVAPIIRDQPVGFTTMEGSNVVLAVTMGGGTLPFSYQWQVGTNGVFVNVANGGNLSGANSTTLAFTSIGRANAASYRFIAKGPSLSTTSAVATITVLSSLPDVTRPSDPIAVYQPNGGSTPGGEGAEHALDNLTSKYLNFAKGTTPFVGPIGFEVAPPTVSTVVTALRFYTANDGPERDPADYLLEGSLDGGVTYMPIATGPVVLPDGRNNGGLALNPINQFIAEVHFANAAAYTKYRLSFSTVKGATYMMQIGEVEILGLPATNAAPTVLGPPTNTTANEGGTATFSVTAGGPGTIGYRWYNVTAGEPGTLIPGQLTATLTLTGITAAMSGNTYRVVVTNQFGSAAPSPALPNPGAQLTIVSGAPVVQTDIPTEALVYAGRTAVLPVTISGTEPFTLRWQKNGINLSDTSRITGSQSNVLAITDAQLADAGNYQLATLSNSQGSAQSALQALTVQNIPTLTPNGVGWGLNGNPSAATISDGVLALTTGAGGTARSAWYTYPLYIGAFKASFLYQDEGGGGADGIAFALQNDARGTIALGGGGGGLGYSGITNSVALQFNIYGTAGIAFNTNGATGGYNTNTAPVNISGGDPIKVDITYAAGVMHLLLSNTAIAGTFTTTLPVGSLPARLGKETAYVGFTGADGGVASTQNISEFTFIPQPTLTAQMVGGAVVLSWPASIGGYQLQSTTNLATPSWAGAGLSVSLVGSHYQATVPGPTGSKFYRLVITP
jgi:hypothetical protein